MSAGAPGRAPGFPFDRVRGPASWLVLLFVAAMVLVWRLDLTARWEPPYLNLVLQIILVSAVSLVVAALAMRSFLRSGNWPVLWLGAGSLTYGLAVALSNSLLQWANVNAAVTTHNLNVLLVALFHLLGAFFAYNGIGRHESSAGRLASVLEVCVGSVLAVSLVTLGAILGLLPPFFVQGQGGTPWRQMVVVLAALLFFLDGLAFLIRYRRSKGDFLYWYALGLLLNSLVMAGTLVTVAIGSPLSWLARGSQILGGLYLLAATLVTLREARARQLSPSDVLASFFWRDEANLRLLFESITDAIIVTDRHFVITDWNHAAEQVYGWKAEEVVGRPVRDVLQTAYLAPGDGERALEALQGAGTWRGEVLQRRDDGSTIAVLSAVSNLKDAAGQVVGAVAVNRDITERKRVEEQLRQSEAKARDLIRYAPTGIYEVDFRTGRFRSVNDAMCEILGYTREELLAMTAFDLLDDPGKLLFGERIRRTLAGEKVDSSVEYRVIKKDGSAIYGVLNTTMTYSGGRPDGAFVIAHDVSERRRAAEELREAASTLERRVRERTAELQQANELLAYQAYLLQNVNDMLIVSDRQRGLIVWNTAAEEMLGWKAEEVLGKRGFEVLKAAVVDVDLEAILRRLAETGRFRGEIVLRRKDGTPVHSEVTILAVKDGDGNIIAEAAVNRDITERKRAEEELRASREQLRNLSRRLVERQEDERRHVANELYNDEGQRLAALLLELGLVEKEVRGNAALESRIARMKGWADGILSDMHNLAVDLRPASLDRLGLMAGLRHYAEELGRQHGLSIQVEVSGSKPVSMSPDCETMLYRIAQEAVTNAVQHSRARQISIIATQHEERLILVIEDDGDGFDLADATRRGGLGIVAMQERAQMLDGKLTIESAPGKGTTVFVELPIKS